MNSKKEKDPTFCSASQVRESKSQAAKAPSITQHSQDGDPAEPPPKHHTGLVMEQRGHLLPLALDSSTAWALPTGKDSTRNELKAPLSLCWCSPGRSGKALLELPKLCVACKEQPSPASTHLLLLTSTLSPTTKNTTCAQIFFKLASHSLIKEWNKKSLRKKNVIYHSYLQHHHHLLLAANRPWVLCPFRAPHLSSAFSSPPFILPLLPSFSFSSSLPSLYQLMHLSHPNLLSAH